MALLVKCKNGHTYTQADIYKDWPDDCPTCPECRKEWEAKHPSVDRLPNGICCMVFDPPCKENRGNGGLVAVVPLSNDDASRIGDGITAPVFTDTPIAPTSGSAACLPNWYSVEDAINDKELYDTADYPNKTRIEIHPVLSGISTELDYGGRQFNLLGVDWDFEPWGTRGKYGGHYRLALVILGCTVGVEVTIRRRTQRAFPLCYFASCIRDGMTIAMIPRN